MSLEKEYEWLEKDEALDTKHQSQALYAKRQPT
jgi:hypothetical protein